MVSLVCSVYLSVFRQTPQLSQLCSFIVNLESGSVGPLNLSFFFNIILTILHPCFYIQILDYMFLVIFYNIYFNWGCLTI